MDLREAASNVLAGHVADSITNAEAVRAFARESEEARIHAGNVHDYGAKAIKSWDYQNTRVDMVTAPMFVLTNTAGLIMALWIGGKSQSSLEAVFITFSYYATATRVMWEFNRVYRNLEGALTDAAQFTELLLDPPQVMDAEKTEPFAPADFGVELRDVSFRHSVAQPLLFNGLSLKIAPGGKIGLVGRSGGGKTTLTRLLLRFSDVDAGELLVGGQSISRIPQAALRKVIAYVPQDPSMFHRSIADNIRVGRPDASDADVRRGGATCPRGRSSSRRCPPATGNAVGERGVKTLRRTAPTCGHCAGNSERRADSGAGRSPQFARLRERGAESRRAVETARGTHSDCHRAPALDRQANGRIDHSRRREYRRTRHARRVSSRGAGSHSVLWAHQSGGFLVQESLSGK